MPPNPQGGMPPNPQDGFSESYHSGVTPSYRGGMQRNYNGGVQQNYPAGVPSSNFNGTTPSNQHRIPPNNTSSGMGSPLHIGGMQPPNSIGDTPPPRHNRITWGGVPQNNFGGLPTQGSMVDQQNRGGYQSNPGWTNTMPQRASVNYTPTRDPSTVPGVYDNYCL